jgi:hypothetical protein
MAEDLKEVVRANVRALLGLKEREKGITRLKEKGIGQGTAQAVLDGSRELRIETITRLADGLHVQPWQLLVPNLDPERLPTLEPAAFRWPFRRIDPEVITGLVGTTAREVENGLLGLLAAMGVQPKAGHGKPVRAGDERATSTR